MAASRELARHINPVQLEMRVDTICLTEDCLKAIYRFLDALAKFPEKGIKQ